MITNATDLVESLKRAVAPIGAFERVFPEAFEEDLAAALLDGLAEAQLDGLLSRFTYDVDTGDIDPALTHAQGALVIIWTASRVVENQITNRPTHFKAEAKGSVFEEDFGPSLFVERLKQLAARKKEILEEARRGQLTTAFHMADLAFAKAVADYSVTDLEHSTFGGF